MQKYKIILASNSPRRKDLLKVNGFNFEVIVSDYEESDFSLDPILTAKTFAKEKVLDVYKNLENKGDVVVVGADTVVFCDCKILGKPKDRLDAYSMLKNLSNKTHTVATGFCIKTENKEIVDVDTTLVTFNDLTDQDINAYLDSGLYKGKAGSYGIQDKEFKLVKEYKGSLDNVIGLPTEKIIPLLRDIITDGE